MTLGRRWAPGTPLQGSPFPGSPVPPETEAQGEEAAQVNKGQADRILGLPAPEPCSSHRAQGTAPLACLPWGEGADAQAVSHLETYHRRDA